MTDEMADRMESPEPLSYEQARDLAANPDRAARETLALRPDAPAEVLYFLAGDADEAVRHAVAANLATPAKGNLILAADPSIRVREQLAAKIGRFGAIGGKAARQARVQDISNQVISRLAQDEVVGIRATMAGLLKDDASAEPDLIRRLAFDRDITVAAPILEYSPLLSDDDLLALIAAGPLEGALTAIARRAFVDARVTAAIAASRDVPAIVHLLNNANANLQEDTLDALVDGAATEPSWQEPLVFRRDLSEASVQRLAEMVTVQVRDRMAGMAELSAETEAVLSREIEDHLRAKDGEALGRVAPFFGPDTETHYAPLLEQAREMAAAGRLDETALMVALLTDHGDDLVAGLAVLAEAPVRSVLEIVVAQSARAMCALAWTAGLSAAFAVELQVRLASVDREAVLKPGPDGGYRLADDEMIWQMDMFGAEVPARLQRSKS